MRRKSDVSLSFQELVIILFLPSSWQRKITLLNRVEMTSLFDKFNSANQISVAILFWVWIQGLLFIVYYFKMWLIFRRYFEMFHFAL